MPNPRGFDHVETWIFDLDNTLYPPSCQLMNLISQRMTLYISDLLSIDPAEALRLQKDYHRQYGTSLRGLMETRGVDPHAFMDFVHDVSHDTLVPDPKLAEAIAALPGKRYVLTNGSRAHAERCAVSLGLADLFHDIYDVAQADFIPKPAPALYDSFIRHVGAKAEGSAMFEDLARNLKVPHALGMTTVLVLPKDEGAGARATHGMDPDKESIIDHVTDDLAGFLSRLKG
jgi:putative hydrolase of the HAD superfamily